MGTRRRWRHRGCSGQKQERCERGSLADRRPDLVRCERPSLDHRDARSHANAAARVAARLAASVLNLADCAFNVAAARLSLTEPSPVRGVR
jgi:hypothetical protein